MPTSATDLIARFGAGTLGVREHAEAVIDAAKAGSGLGAILSLDDKALLDQADIADKRYRNGSARTLEGLCLAVKDNIDTADLPTTCGTRAFRGPAPLEAEALGRLSRLGALVAMKTNLHELAYGITSNNAVFGAVHNPWRSNHIAGGSSGGTAAVVAAGIVPAGLGTDTGGSVRIPAALCGVAGLRPSTGRYPAAGVAPISSTRDTIGPIATCVADLALLDRAMARDPALLLEREARSIRLGVPRSGLWEDLETGLGELCESILRVFAGEGVTLVEADPPGLMAHTESASFPIALYETMQELPMYAERRGVSLSALIDGVGSPDVRRILESQLGDDAVTSAIYSEAMTVHRPALQRIWAEYFRENRLDGAIFPTTPLTARPIGCDEMVEIDGRWSATFETYVRNTSHSTLIGAPGVSLPIGFSRELPVGLEIDGLPGADLDLLSVAAALERLISTA